MESGPLNAKVAQADFIKAIGAVVPNARIDFQQSGSKAVIVEQLPCNCSTESATAVWEAASTDQTSEVWEGLAGITENCHARTPGSGTPEWTPRSTCVDPNCPEWTPECVKQGQKDPVQQVLEASCCPENVAVSLPPAQLEQPQPVPQPASTQVWYASPAPASDNYTWYRVAYLGGIELRMQPSYLAARTGALLPQNEVFAVSNEIVGADGRIYLRLADGRGWAFDDSALLPHDPSVIRGHFAPTANAATPTDPVAPSCNYVTSPCSYQGLTMQAETSIQAHSPSSVSSPCSYAPPYMTAEQPPMQSQAAEHWAHMTHNQPYLQEPLVAASPHTWIPPVTSECPPTWEPSVGKHAEEHWASEQWG